MCFQRVRQDACWRHVGLVFLRRLDTDMCVYSELLETSYKWPAVDEERHQLTPASSSMMKSVLVLLALASLANAASVYNAPVSYYETPAAYAYNYGVADSYSGAHYNAGEQRNGGSTSGSYSVALPDGRVQTVNYHVADAYSGFVADVQYSGVPHYNSYVPKTYSTYPAYKAGPAYKPTPVYQSLPVYSG